MYELSGKMPFFTARKCFCIKNNGEVEATYLGALRLHQSCQPLMGVNLSPEFVNLYIPHAGQGLLFFCRWQWHF